MIGLGQFGSAICKALVRAGQEVMAIDVNEAVVNDFADLVMRAVIADAQDEDAMRELDLGHFDHVYISIGKHVETSIMATLIAKDLGVKDVVCRAENRNHARVLERIGADMVVRPEHDLAERLVFSQLHPSVLDYVRISKNVTLAEIEVNNPAFYDKTLDEMDFRNRYHVNVILCVDKDDQINQLPQGSNRIHQHDKLTVIGPIEAVGELNDLLQKK